MKKILSTILTFIAACTFMTAQELYKDPTAPIEKRVEDLLSRMTLEEKVGQMNQFVGVEHIKMNEASLTEEQLRNNTANAFYPGITSDTVAKWTEQGIIGSFLHVLTLKEANWLQSLAMKSRLGIPIIFGIDAIHGNANAPENTVYPTNIGLASSFDTALAYKIAIQTAREMRAMNMHWTFNPNVEVARDPRWGRVGETYGEDPYLVGAMGEQTVLGYQNGLGPEKGVLACVKHFVGGSQPINGTNGSPTDLSERTIREVFFPPFKRGAEAQAATFMTAHNELNGTPCHSDKWLMEDVLRGEWNFKGFIVSDWMDIEHINDVHYTAENLKEAFYQSIVSGMDMHMHGIHWNEMVCALVREGRITESRIDESVRRILYTKFLLGLFEHPYADEAKTMEVRLCDEHRKTALEASREAIVLLKNDGILPLNPKKYRKVLVTGINANDQNLLGDWSAAAKDENVVTVLEGLREIAPKTSFTFVNQGWDPRNMNPEKVQQAADAAKESDLNIVVAGEYMMRFRWMERTSGEDTDRSDNYLVGLQEELIKKVAASGKPTVLILISGRPLSFEWAADNLPAIINAWEPGMYGGTAIAEILYGKVNPSAKLSVTMPRSTGQVQMIYNHKPSQYFHPYALTSSKPLYPFGFGLSYSTFEYSAPKLSSSEGLPKDSVKVSFTIKNTSKVDGVEIVQLYIRDCFSTFTRPVKELKDFARVALKAGETKEVIFNVSPEKLAMLNREFKPVVEPGEFIIMVGGSSRDEDLKSVSYNVVSRRSLILEKLGAVAAEGKYLFGHQDSYFYGHSWNGFTIDTAALRSDVHEVTGSYPAILGCDLGDIELGHDKNLDKVPFEDIRRAIILQNCMGGLSTISWHANNPVTGSNAWDVTCNTVVRDILPSGSRHAEFLVWLDRVSDFLLSLRDSDGELIPVIFRPYHEHTGSWFWWGRDLCSEREYKELWQFTYSYLTGKGLTNLIWAYSPAAGKGGYMNRYPGDACVDILGLDAYQAHEYSDKAYFIAQTKMELAQMKVFAAQRGKLFALTETGSESLKDASWWTGTLNEILRDSGACYTLIWRNACDIPTHFYAPFKGQKSAKDFVEFYKLNNTIFSGYEL